MKIEKISSSQVLLMKCSTWQSSAGVSTSTKAGQTKQVCWSGAFRCDISNDLRQAVVAAH